MAHTYADILTGWRPYGLEGSAMLIPIPRPSPWAT
jgi:hypothetical protein